MTHEALDILQTFNKEEFRRFRYFAASPYFNKDQNIEQLFEALIKFYPDFKNEKLNDNYLLEKTGNKNKSTLRVYFLRLRDLVIEFLVYNYLQSAEHSKYIYCLEELETRNLTSIYKKQKEKYLKFLKDPERRVEILDYFHTYKFYLVEYNMLGRITEIIKKGKHANISLYQNRIGTSLTYFYLLESLKDWIQSKWQQDAISQRCYNKNENSLKTFFEEGQKTDELFKSVIKDEINPKNKKVLKVYYLIYKCYSEKLNDKEVLKNLKQLLAMLNSLPSNLSQYEREYIIAVSRNAVCRFTNKISDKEMEYAINEIYLKTFVSKENPIIQTNTFSRIFLGALMHDLLSWAEKNLKRYKNRIKLHLYEFCLSALRFYKCYKSGKYREASEIFLQLKTNDINAKLNLKFLQIYLHYDQDDYLYTQRLVNNLRKYIYNHSAELSEFKTKDVYSFSNLIELLCSYRMQPSEKKLIKLKTHVDGKRSIFIRRKIDELPN